MLSNLPGWRLLLGTFALLALPLTGFTQLSSPLGPVQNPLWLRYPAISPDGKSVVFVWRGHLYLVGAEGGRATALTTGSGHATSPVWSPDGKLIAYAAEENGNLDVFVVSIEGGPPRRLTMHSADEIPTSFSQDSKEVYISAHRMDTARSAKFPSRPLLPEFYRVSIDGGKAPVLVLSTPALHGQFDRAGKRLLYEDLKGYENLFRKHETYSIAHDIWMYDVDAKKHTRLTTFPGEDREPVWAPDEASIFYLSEQSGSSNIFKLNLGSDPAAKPQPITTFRDNPVRFLSCAHTGALCFGYDGEIYLLPPGGMAPAKLAVTIGAEDAVPLQSVQSLSQGATEVAISPNGKEIAFAVQGAIYVASVQHGDTKRITQRSGEERNVSFSSDGRRLIFAAEYNRPWAIYEASIKAPKEKEPYFFAATDLDVHPVVENGQENFQPLYSPDGKEIAYLENRTTLRVFSFETKQSRVVMDGPYSYSYADGDQWFDWCPDGRWLLATFLDRNRYSQKVGLIDASGKSKPFNLTEGGYEANSPVWVNGGKGMIWLTDRQGLRGSGAGAVPEQDVYEMFFTRDAYTQYHSTPAEYDILKLTTEKKPAEKDKPKDSPVPAVEPIKLELSGIEDRTERLTISSAKILDALLSTDGETLYYLAMSDKNLDFWSLKLREKELKRVAQFEPIPPDAIEDPNRRLTLSVDGKFAVVLVNGKIFKVGLDDSKTEPLKFVAEHTSDKSAEFAELFEHIWRQTKEKFYTVDMHGVDWDKLKGVYAKFLPYIADNYDFAELASEMLGELNASHTGCYYRPADREKTAALGIFFDYKYQGPGLKIEDVVEGGPAALAPDELKQGMIIEKINGTTIAAGQEIDSLLARQAERVLTLAVFNPADQRRFETRVKAVSLAEQNALLYRRWVKKRRDDVERLSHGTIGYVHVRGMDDNSYRDVFSETLGRFSGKKAVIIDTRYNGGGNLHDSLANFLNGQRYLEFLPRGQSLGWEGTGRWTGKSIVLVGESNYSDAHLFPWLYQHLKLGKIVGMQVPATGTAVWWETIGNEHNLRFGIPEVGFRDAHGKFMEREPVDPDIIQANDAQSLSDGVDQQLERAVQELTKEM